MGRLFYKKGICPKLSHIFFLTSKHSLSPLQNSTKIFNRIQTSQALIPDSRLNLKLQFSIPIFIKNSPKLRYVGWLWKPSFPQVQPFILYFTSSLWVLMIIYELLNYGITTTHPIMVYFCILSWNGMIMWCLWFSCFHDQIMKVDIYIYIYVCCWWADLYGFWNWLDLVLLKDMILSTWTIAHHVFDKMSFIEFLGNGRSNVHPMSRMIT